MIDRRRAALTILLLASAASSATTVFAAPASGSLCSMKAPSVIRLRDPQAIAFVGTGTDDTVFAGPGTVQYGTDDGHFGPGTPRSIYGQRVRVDRAEQTVSQSFREAMAAGDRTVVLVPWDYGPDCRRVVWNRSARWMQPGTNGAFVVRSRPREHWVGDRPTFDVTPDVALYPPSFPHQRSRPWDTTPRVTADDFLTLYELLPDRPSLYADSSAAMGPLVRWAQTNPERAAQLPVIPLLSFMRWEARMHLYRSKPSVLAGTYRIVYRVASGDSAVIFARTELHPSSLHLLPRVSGRDTSAIDDRRPIGHYLLVEVARTPGELPQQRRDATNPRNVQGYLAVVDSALAPGGDSATLPGSIDLHGQAARLTSDSTLAAAIRDAGRHQARLQSDLYRRREPGTLGVFTIAPDGRLRYELTIDAVGARVLSVTAERISTQHLRVLRPPY